MHKPKPTSDGQTCPRTLQAFENMATVESEGLKGRRAALLEHSLLARIYSGELHVCWARLGAVRGCT